ncbi:unnamed protein product [Allacma fusca]|uniref:Uncharacterized protein n=1 Tax=Allacma fusca TaxID=39272 RepID=A0A8J2JKK2_9HEXA|nr:unnamed protein product [Allacma fusca]
MINCRKQNIRIRVIRRPHDQQNCDYSHPVIDSFWIE